MARFRDRLRSEDGFSFPELTVAAMIGLIIAAGAMGLVVTLVRAQPEVSQRASQIQQGRVMLEQLTRELRQGDEVTNASASGMRIHTWVDGSQCGGTPGVKQRCWITYACTAGTCTRTPDGQPARTVVTGISGSSIFCYAAWSGQSSCPAPSASAPGYVAVRVIFAADDGGETVTLDDGTALRNA